MWDKLSSILTELFTAGLNWFYIAYKAGAYPEFYWLWFFFIIFTVWLASGFIAATIAEMRSHKMKLHFCMGLLLPYVYPFLLLNHLKKLAHVEKVDQIEEEVGETYQLTAKLMGKIEEKEAVKQAKIDARRLFKEKTASSAADRLEAAGLKSAPIAAPEQSGESLAAPAPAPAPEPEIQTKAVSAEPSKFTRGFFESLSVDEAGNRVGPFSIKLKDHSALTAETIKSVQDDLAIFEILNKNGDIKNIRIKFANIESCEKMN
ncbi:MAG: hypothetical protein WCV67_17195 [Victivallaceae bacterium]|jgi:hypothetical protein